MKGKTDLHFVEPGVKINKEYYQSEILVNIVNPLNDSLFKGAEWTFQQDSAPSHKAVVNQNWLKKHVPNFISVEEWPPASPDLNPMDYCIWSLLEEKVCSKRHKNLGTLKLALTKEWNNFSMDLIRAAIKNWIPRLKACKEQNGDIFEI